MLRKVNLSRWAYFLLWFMPIFSYADPSISSFENPPFLAKTLQTFTLLGVVIVLIFIIRYLVNRFVMPRIATGRGLKLAGILALGSRERIALIEVKDVILVVGITPTQINTLHVFPPVKAEQL